jgi:hypothetical protein
VLCGCNEPERASVKGTVTLDGQPVDGFITFFPIQSQEPTHGVKIINGSFEVSGLTPGRKRVLVSTAPERTEKGKFIRPKNTVLPSTPGNNRIVDIAAGQQTVDMSLTK